MVDSTLKVFTPFLSGATNNKLTGLDTRIKQRKERLDAKEQSPHWTQQTPHRPHTTSALGRSRASVRTRRIQEAEVQHNSSKVALGRGVQRVLHSHKAAILDLACSDDGQIVVTAGAEGYVKVGVSSIALGAIP
jgi:hypothetical protein